MIQPDELAICKRRGHAFAITALHNGWVQCQWCGTWVREVRTKEERVDDPPLEERNEISILKDKLKKLEEGLR